MSQNMDSHLSADRRWLRRSLGMLGIAVSSIVFGWLQSFMREQVIVYWASVCYTPYAFVLVLTSGCLALITAIRWTVSVFGRHASLIGCNAVILIVIATLIAALAVPPALWVLEPMYGVRIGMWVYHVALDERFDGDDARYILYKCGPMGVICKAHDFLPNHHLQMPVPVVRFDPQSRTVTMGWPSGGTP
jgi:hypothetical protein